MTSSPDAAAPPTTVLVNGRLASAGVVERCVERVLATVAPGTTVLAFTARSTRLPAPLARRARNARGGLEEYLAVVRHEVAQDRVVVVLPASATAAAPGWLEAARERLQEQPHLVGVLGPDGEQLFGFPRGVVDVDGPQCVWAPLPGLDLQDRRRTAGHRSLAAVLIVKDEEEVLEACLRAVTPFVDEVVVYDTGSSDSTLQIARRLATTVVEGYWDDDFGAARDRALAHATSDWVLSLDADEVAEGDPAGLRSIVDATAADGMIVSIVSTRHGRGTQGDATRATRLFERARASWSGTLHEQVVFDGGTRPARLSAERLPLTLVHSGYSAATMAAKDKRVRNLDIARSAHDSAALGSPQRADAAAHLGRALAGDGQVDAALEVLGTLLTSPASPGNNVQGARVAVPLAVQRRQLDAVEAWCDLARRDGEAPGQVAVWRAAVLLGRGRVDDAAAVLDDLLSGDGGADLWGTPFDPDLATTLRAEIDLEQGDAASAAARMRGALQRQPDKVNFQVLVNALGGLGLTMRDLIDEAPAAFLDRALRDVVLLPPRTALHWFSAHSAAAPDDFRPVVAGCAVAARTGWADALEWSARAREAGLEGVCPLRDLAEDDERAGVERALAWALLFHGFGAADGPPRFAAQLDDLRPVDRNAALALVREVVPDIDPSFFPVVGAPLIRRRAEAR